MSQDRSGAISTGLARLDSLNRKHRVKGISPLFKGSAGVLSRDHFRHVYLLTINEDTDINALRDEYMKLPEIEYAEPDYMVEFYDYPNDAFYPHQWGLNNAGQEHYHIVRRPGPENDKMIITAGIADADIDAREVFQNPPDNTFTVVVAIIDTGVDMDHPDLTGSIWINPYDIPENGIDDDNNGYVDDINGWDFSASDDIIMIDVEDNDPTDEFGHGTHCAGIVAGIANNSIGITGVSKNCMIMSLKIDPWPLISKIARAIIYAADNDADVINMSFGMSYRSFLLEEAIDYARAKGVILCAATGNSGREESNYPAALASTIAVGATDDSDRVTEFSTFGEHINVCAPGLSILSLRADFTDMYADEEPGVHIVADHYYLASGTSMACPHLVGVAAYMRSVSPGLTPEMAQTIIEQSADDFIDPYGLGWAETGWDRYSGYGRVNLLHALEATPVVWAAIESPHPNQVISGEVEIRGIAAGDDFIGYVLDYGKGKNPSSWDLITISTAPVMNGPLGVWSTAGLTGYYTIRLRLGDHNIFYKNRLESPDFMGPISSRYIKTFVANETAVEIIFPELGDTLSNIVDIVADAYCPDFKHFVLEYGSGSNPAEWKEIARLSMPVKEALISDWIVEPIPEGEYTLRVAVYSTNGLESLHEIQIFVRSSFSSENAWKVNLNATAPIAANYGDFDNDGLDEIIVGTSSGIKVYNPDGTSKIDGLPDFPNNEFLVPIAVGNLDRDAVDDIVMLGSNPPVLYGFRSGGERYFEHSLELELNVDGFLESEHDFPKLFLKDIDNDGRDEIHLVVMHKDSPRAFLFASNGNLRATFPLVSEYLPADLDGNGNDELYVFAEADGFIKQLDAYGSVTDSFLAEIDGSSFSCQGISAYDIDGDCRLELIVFGLHQDKGFWIYAFEDGLNLKPGWPHETGIDGFLVPTVPIFGDIDDDGEPEYMCTYFDLSVSYVHVWNLNGTSFIPGNPNGLFATISRPGVLNMPVLVDVNGDDELDIVACANDDMFFTYRAQRIYAWDRSGEPIPGFPLITVPEIPLYYSSGFRFLPSVGDIDHDGNVDLVMPTADSSLVFVNFPGKPYNASRSCVPFWRYNRKLNNVGTMDENCNPTEAVDQEMVIPQGYRLSQNYPNPFNPSTMIEYSLPTRAHVNITVYNILGQEVRTLVNKSMPPGNYRILWDGTDNSGAAAASGIYMYHILATDFDKSKKMILLR